MASFGGLMAALPETLAKAKLKQYKSQQSGLPQFAPTTTPEETLARQGITSTLQGQLAPGLQRMLSDVANQQYGQLNRMGILTGGQTYPSVLRAQSERLLFPAYQQAQEQGLGLGERLWGREYQPWQTQYQGTLSQQLQAASLAAQERMAKRAAEAQKAAAESQARGTATGGLYGGLGSFLGSLFGK